MVILFLNETLHPLPISDTEQIILSTWKTISLVLCFTGNTFVLFSMKYDAIRLDRISMYLVRRICFADLSHGTFQLLPKLISMIAGNTWILGEEFAVLVVSTKSSFFLCNLALVCFLSVNKMLHCLNPLGMINSPSWLKRLFDSFSSLAFCTPSLWYFCMIVRGYYIIFYSELLCDLYLTTSKNNKYSYIEFIILIAFFLIPTFVLLVSNISLVIIAIKNAVRPLKKKCVIAIIVVSSFFCLYAVSIFIWFCFYEFMPELDGMLKTPLRVHASKLIFHLDTIASFINPVIYFVTLKCFRDFCMNFKEKNLTGKRGRRVYAKQTALSQLSSSNL